MRVYVPLIAAVFLSAATACAARKPAAQYVDNLDSDVERVRRNAARSLGRIGVRSAVPELIESLNDPSPGVRREAARALGLIHDERAAAALAEALDDPNTDVRFYAAYALGQLRPRRAVEPLVDALHDRAWCVRDQAAWALREIREARGVDMVPFMVEALKNESADVDRISSIFKDSGGKAVVRRLSDLLESERREVLLRAVKALTEMGGKEAVPSLIKVLDKRDAGIRLQAIRALKTIGDDRAAEPLKRLASEAQSPKVRRAAKEAAFRLSLRPDMVAFWNFDEMDGQTVKDLSGRGNHAENRGCSRVQGKVGKALEFSEGNYVMVGKPAGLPMANKPLTIMAWARPEAGDGVVVARGGGWTGFSLYLKDGVPAFGIHRKKEGDAYIVRGERKLHEKWVHLAGVITEDGIELYVNGELEGGTSTPGYLPNNAGQPMMIGFDTHNSATELTTNFKGVIDEVKVFHATLSADAIAEQAYVKQGE